MYSSEETKHTEWDLHLPTVVHICLYLLSKLLLKNYAFSENLLVFNQCLILNLLGDMLMSLCQNQAYKTTETMSKKMKKAA